MILFTVTGSFDQIFECDRRYCYVARPQNSAAGAGEAMRDSLSWHLSLEEARADLDLDRTYVASPAAMQAIGVALKLCSAPKLRIKPLRYDLNRAAACCPGLSILGAGKPAEIAAFGLPSNVAMLVIAPYNAFGDAVVFTTCLREIRRRFALSGIRLSIDIWMDPAAGIEEIYHWSEAVRDIHYFPQPLSTLSGYALLMDFYGCNIGPNLAMLDYFLGFAGLEPRSVPLRFKRNRLRVRTPGPSAYGIAEGRVKFDRLIALCANASTPIRCMPKDALGRLLAALDGYPRWGIVTTHAVDGAGPSVLDVSSRSRTFADFVGILACCDGVICVDSATYHVADALDLPTLVFFTTNRCRVWTASYPRAMGVQVGSPGHLAGMHFSDNPVHVAYAQAQWAEVDFAGALDEFRQAVEGPSVGLPRKVRWRGRTANAPRHSPASSKPLAAGDGRSPLDPGGRTS